MLMPVPQDRKQDSWDWFVMAPKQKQGTKIAPDYQEHEIKSEIMCI